jgi:hypothetical protein
LIAREQQVAETSQAEGLMQQVAQTLVAATRDGEDSEDILQAQIRLRAGSKLDPGN